MIGVTKIADQKTLNKIGGQLLKLNGKKADPSDFSTSSKVVICIHGFTADASYLATLLNRFNDSGFTTLAYNYPCYAGIDKAAENLFEHLEGMDKKSGGSLAANKIILVGHSMGGLVARAIILLNGGHQFVRKVITLGSPNNGTLKNNKILEYYLAWGEAVSAKLNIGYSKSRRSAMQLLGTDAPLNLLDKLTNTAPATGSVRFYSLSGGMPELEFGKNPLLEWVANRAIQLQLGSKPNDGLVEEISSDLSQSHFLICAPGCKHFNKYVEYPQTNHKYLVENDVVGLKIVEFAEDP